MPDQSDDHSPSANSATEPISQSPVLQTTAKEDKVRKDSERNTGQALRETVKLERDIKTGEILMVVLTALLLITNLVIAKIYYGQLQEMRKATEAATKSANTADATLKEIQSG